MSHRSLNARIDAWLRRFLFSFAGVVIGALLIIGMAIMLFWNEHAVVLTQQTGVVGETETTIWATRVLGLVAMVIGFALLTGPLRVVAGIVPVFGSIVGFGTGILATASGLSLGILVIALPYALHSPGTALAILLGGLLGVTIITHLGIYVGVRIANAREKAAAELNGPES